MPAWAGERLLSLEEALKRMLARVEPLSAEDVALTAPAELLGRVASGDVTARLSMPPWDDSAMDGFAVRAADVDGASAGAAIQLRVIGEAAAGKPSSAELQPGTAIRILTGAPVPAGADAVVPVELTDAPRGMADLPAEVSVHATVALGAHIRPSGSDLVAGRVVILRGTPISPHHVAGLVAAGHATVAVHARPRVAVLSTGDELTDPGAFLGPGRIHDSSGPGIAAQVVAAGGRLVSVARARDHLNEVERALRAAVAAADVVLVTGGVSVGAHDVVKDAFERIGEIDLWRVAIQPGKPLAFGRALRADGGTTLLFGLPGNPVSSFVTFELFVRPVLKRF
ncbi:MAG: molybdopterin molybdotransferase MoeA, partial [Chloroflexi bacterium]|nr:molybdopterin molybdotransferase MoeA [Chloroflexota bacterium]